MSLLSTHAAQTAKSATARRLLNVELSVDSLGSSMTDLCDAITALEDVLAPLLGHAPVQGDCADRVSGDSEVSERILQNADAAGRYAARIRSLIARL